MSRFDLAVPADIRFGSGRVAEVPDAVQALGASRVLVVTGSRTERAAAVRAALAARGVTTVVHGVSGEPTVEVLRAVLATAREEHCDGVLGYSGGSAIDIAKAAAVLAPSGADPMDHLEVVGAGRPIRRRGLPCIAVPTTAGTGSEVTRNAVLAAGEVKASLRSPFLLPDVAIVDPDLLDGVPPATVAASGMDALSQLIEPLLSQRANPFTDALARDGIRRSARSLGRGYQHGLGDPGTAEDLALASLFGGLCLANSGLGVVHGIAAAAGARLGAPHGAVCAAVLAASYAVNAAAVRERGETAAQDRVVEVARLLTDRPDADVEDAVQWLEELRAALQIPGLGAYGLAPSGVEAVLVAAQRASSMRGNPIPLSDDEVRAILLRSL